MAVIVLALVFALGVGSVAPRDLVLGVLVGAAALWIARAAIRGRAAPSTGLLDAVIGTAGLLALTGWDIVRGTSQVVLVVLGLRSADRAGFVEVPFDERTDDGVRVTALLTTMSPGDVVLHLDRDRRVMLVHTIDADDPEGFRERLRDRYRLQRRAWP